MVDIEIAEFEVPYPDNEDMKLQLNLGACRLNIKPSNGGSYFVEGTYEHPVGTLTPHVVMKGGSVKISQDMKLGNVSKIFKTAPTFDLAVGTSKPYELRIETGAVEANFDLGGMPLTRLIVKEGAGSTKFDFSTPNPEDMSLLDIDAGAVSLEMKNLGNANFAEMKVDGGAASYKLDFGGTLRRAANVEINTGLASVELIIPSSTAARVEPQTTLANIDADKGYTQQNDAYWTQAAINAQSPLLTIRVNASLGSVSLKTV